MNRIEQLRDFDYAKIRAKKNVFFFAGTVKTIYAVNVCFKFSEGIPVMRD